MIDNQKNVLPIQSRRQHEMPSLGAFCDVCSHLSDSICHEEHTTYNENKNGGGTREGFQRHTGSSNVAIRGGKDRGFLEKDMLYYVVQRCVASSDISLFHF